jgi:hypothetical protein
MQNKPYEIGRKHIDVKGNDKCFRLVECYNQADNIYRYEIQLYHPEEKKFLVYKPFSFKPMAESYFSRL